VQEGERGEGIKPRKQGNSGRETREKEA